jgi:hypothetical protein
MADSKTFPFEALACGEGTLSDRLARTTYHLHLIAYPGRNPSVAILAASTICEMFLDSTRFFVPSRCFLLQQPNTIARAQNHPQPPA